MMVIGYGKLLEALRDERGFLRNVLRGLTANEWAGWGYDADNDKWRCFYCQAQGPEERHGPPSHRPDCLITVGREALIDAASPR